MSAEEPDDDVDAPGRPDLFADLFFGLGAICILAVIVLAPMIGLTASENRRAADRLSDRLHATRFTIDGRPVEALFAGPEGVLWAGIDAPISADRLAEDTALRGRLAAAKDGGLVVVIEPGGEEAAFSLEPLIAAFGPPTIRQVRADRACAFARASLRSVLCTPTPAETPT